MEQRKEAKQITVNNSTFTIYKENVKIRVILEDINKIEEKYVRENLLENEKLWAKINDETIENEKIKTYSGRLEIVSNIINKMLKSSVEGVVIDFENLDNNKIKLIDELIPRLSEIGITTGIKINSSINEEDYIRKIDYIIK